VISKTLTTDFLVIGSGAAGLHAAWHASRYGQVTLVTKSDLETSSSYWAQGGIAAVLDPDQTDSYGSHKEDTLTAGRELCHNDAVDILVREGASCVRDLIEAGMRFDRTDEGELELGLEGGHSNRRVIHANGAATGQALVEFLTRLVKQQSNIQIIENSFVYRLIADQNCCRGAHAYLYKDNVVLNLQSPVTILATGGYSGLYKRSTNPHTSTGDGMWLGYNVGARLKDLEFVQFHPTAFYSTDGEPFLISEAVRGEGAYLLNEAGERFMSSYPRQELEPRDVVAQEILNQIEQQDSDYVSLDLRHLDLQAMRAHFPNILDHVEQRGIDINREGIPVAPAAHYCIGGVATDLNAQTSIPGLFACGEVAATGVHGANRLASNSLLECLVFSKRAVELSDKPELSSSSQNSSGNFRVDVNGEDRFLELQTRVANLLSRYAGIHRSEKGLKTALDVFNRLSEQHSEKDTEYYNIRSRGLLEISELIVRSALERTESRGVHLRTDFPDTDTALSNTEFTNELLTV